MEQYNLTFNREVVITNVGIAVENAIITFTVKPDTGYYLSKLTLNGEDAKINWNSEGTEGTISETMPKNGFVVYAEFTFNSKENPQPTDVPYFVDRALYIAEKGDGNGNSIGEGQLQSIKFSGGEGTKGDPLKVKGKDEFYQILNDQGIFTGVDDNFYFELIEDIDLTKESNVPY